MALPSNVGHGIVTGRFIDSTGNPIEGKVTFTPTPKRLLNASAQPVPVTILPQPVTVELSDGAFTQSLIATDDPDNNPSGWTYSIKFGFNNVAVPGFDIEVPEGAEIDLTTVSPVGSGNGTIIIRGKGVPEWDGVPDGQVIVLVNGEPAWGSVGGGEGGTSLTTYAQVSSLADYPDSFPPDLDGVTPASIGAQPAGSYATDADLAGKQNALVPGTNISIDDTDPDNPVISATGGGGGDQGPKGDDGDSAYDLWLADGNTGTVEDFLASLVGPQGDPGVDGADGEQGLKGDPGDDGAPGADGADGADGEDGHSPVITWDDTTIVVDGIPGPDLQGPAGTPPEGTVTSETITQIVSITQAAYDTLPSPRDASILYVVTG